MLENQDNAEVEDIDFIITIVGQYWDKKPQYSITLKDKIIYLVYDQQPKEIKVSTKLPTTTETSCILKINLLNKESTDTKKDQYNDPDNFTIIDDMLLTVQGIEIDGITLPVGDQFDHTDDVGYYLVDEPVTYKGVANTTKVVGCTTMGWNGSYCYKFSTPVYLWLLEQIS